MILHDKAIIITGGARGLGRGIAEVCLREGARCMLADRDAEGVRQTTRELGDHAAAVPCDVTKEADLACLVQETVERFGRIDGLVNNAGINFNRPFLSSDATDWANVIQTNLTPVYTLTQRVIARMLAQSPTGGSIVNVASVHALATAPGAGPYAAAKAGIVGLSRAVALEFASQGIRVNAVSPGLCDTGIWQDVIASAKDKAACEAYWYSNIPIGRALRPQEIGEVVAFMLSARSSALTGANIVADGGLTANLLSRTNYE